MSDSPGSKYEYDVFLSHNSKDKAVVEKVGAFLASKGIKVWFDKWEIDFGQSIPQEVNAGVEKSRYLLLFLSEHFADTDWGNYEHQTVQFVDPLNKQGRVLPFKIDGAHPPNHIAPFKYFDYHADSDEALRQLLNKLRGRPLKPDFTADKVKSRPPRAEPVPTVPSGPFKLHGLPNIEVELFGRDPEQDALDAAWNDELPRVVGLVGEGGQGKSALLHTWLNDFRRDRLRGAECVLVHSFYRQTTPSLYGSSVGPSRASSVAKPRVCRKFCPTPNPQRLIWRPCWMPSTGNCGPSNVVCSGSSVCSRLPRGRRSSPCFGKPV